MTPAQHVQPALASAQIHIRDITGSDLRGALADGWDDFKDKRGDIIIIGFAYPVIGLMLAVLALGYSLLTVVFPLAAGLSSEERRVGEGGGGRCRLRGSQYHSK